MSVVVFLIDSVLDRRIRTHAAFDYVVFEAECYEESISLLDSADARLRIGDNIQYTWNQVHWDGQRLESFINMLELIEIFNYKLSVLTEGHLYQQGSLVL